MGENEGAINDGNFEGIKENFFFLFFLSSAKGIFLLILEIIVQRLKGANTRPRHNQEKEKLGKA